MKRINLSLSLYDKQFLYRKYRNNGLNHKEAKEKVDKINTNIKNLMKKLKDKEGITEDDLNKKFLVEFEKICNEY